MALAAMVFCGIAYSAREWVAAADAIETCQGVGVRSKPAEILDGDWLDYFLGGVGCVLRELRGVGML